MREKHYSIHGIISFRINTKFNFFGRFLPDWDIELQGFESSSTGNPDFVISMGRFSPGNQNCNIIDDDYYIREDYLYCRDRYQYARWQLEMSGFEKGNMVAHIHSNLLGNMLIPEAIINHLIWFKLNEKGFPIIHGSGVSRNGLAYIFAGQGAAGKSTVALSLVERGFKLLSEHFGILHEGVALNYSTPFHIMDFNLVPIIKKNMNFRHKASFQLKQLFHRLTRKRIATKIFPVDLLPNSLVDKAKLHAVFLLLPRENLKMERIGKEELIGHLVMNQKLESFPFIRYMMEYAYLFPQSAMADYWVRYEENLREALDSVGSCYRVEVPQRYDSETLQKIADLVDKC